MDPPHNQEGKQVQKIHLTYIEIVKLPFVHLKENVLKNQVMTQGFSSALPHNQGSE